jgi:hypothetical protein
MAGVSVFILGFAVYAASLRNGFAYDDVAVVQTDDRVKQFLIEPIFSKPYWATPGFALYRPLVTLSFAVDWAISGGDPAWFHAVNALWHALASMMVFVLLLAWFKTGPSWFGGLLFAVHPVHAEAVANVVGRAELMASALLLAACACWAHGWPRDRVRRTLTVVLLFALATLCKESAVVLPALLVLIDAARGEWKSFHDLPAYARRHHVGGVWGTRTASGRCGRTRAHRARSGHGSAALHTRSRAHSASDLASHRTAHGVPGHAACGLRSAGADAR